MKHLETQTETSKQDAYTEPMHPVQQDNETQTEVNQLCDGGTMTDNPKCKDSETSMEKIENTSNETQTDTLSLATVETQTTIKTFRDIGIQVMAIANIIDINELDKGNVEFVYKIIETLQINKYYEFFYYNVVTILTINSYTNNREKLFKIAQNSNLSESIIKKVQDVKGTTADKKKSNEISSKFIKNIKNLKELDEVTNAIIKLASPLTENSEIYNNSEFINLNHRKNHLIILRANHFNDTDITLAKVEVEPSSITKDFLLKARLAKSAYEKYKDGERNYFEKNADKHMKHFQMYCKKLSLEKAEISSDHSASSSKRNAQNKGQNTSLILEESKENLPIIRDDIKEPISTPREELITMEAYFGEKHDFSVYLKSTNKEFNELNDAMFRFTKDNVLFNQLKSDLTIIRERHLKIVNLINKELHDINETIVNLFPDYNKKYMILIDSIWQCIEKLIEFICKNFEQDAENSSVQIP